MLLKCLQHLLRTLWKYASFYFGRNNFYHSPLFLRKIWDFIYKRDRTSPQPFSSCVEWLQFAAKMNQPVRLPSLSSTREQHFGARRLFHQLHWLSITIIVFGSIIREVAIINSALIILGQQGIKIANISKVSTNEWVFDLV